MDARVKNAASPDAPLRIAAEGFRSPVALIDELPGPGGALPVLGHLHKFKNGAGHATFEQWARDHGALFKFRLGSAYAVGVAEPRLIHEVLRHRPREMSRSPRLSSIIDELGFRGLFTADGERWRPQRKLVMRALTPEAIRHFFPIITTVTERLLARWQAGAREGRVANVPRDLKRYSIDVTTWLALGVDIDTLNHDDNPLQEDVELWFATIGRRLSSLVPHWRKFKLPADRRVDRMLERLAGTVDALIADARKRLNDDPALRLRPRNILEALVAARDEPGSEFDDEDVRGNVATMLFAGEDTTANAMAWLLYFLAVHPAVAARAAAEVDAVLAGEALPGFAALDRLEYLEAAAMEGMRLKPIAPVQGAFANVDIDLAGLSVPRGTMLFLLPRVPATDAANFEEPQAFKPERWLEGAAADETRRRVFPFGGGPRYCPGRYLAMVEIRMVASMALRHFALELDLAPEAVREHYTFTLGPASLPVRFVRREA